MKCVDLFAGCGGMSLGFQNAGVKILASIDNWDKAVEVYNNNFFHTCYQHDIKDKKGTLKIIKRYNPDMIIGGSSLSRFFISRKKRRKFRSS